MKEITETITKVTGYEAIDGTLWKTKSECEDYEQELNKKESKMYSVVLQDKYGGECIAGIVKATNKKHACNIAKKNKNDDFYVIECQEVVFNEDNWCSIYYG